jgi:hypothetical protein
MGIEGEDIKSKGRKNVFNEMMTENSTNIR